MLQKVESALIPGLNGPLFPKGIDDLNQAWEVCEHGVPEQLCRIASNVMRQGRVGGKNFKTSDGYAWYRPLEFSYQQGRVIVLLSWRIDEGSIMRLERSIAFYKSGTLKEGTIERICRRLTEEMGK